MHFWVINLLLLRIFLFSGRKLISSFCLTHLIVGRNLKPGSCCFGSLTKGVNHPASPDLPDVRHYLFAQTNQPATAVFWVWYSWAGTVFLGKEPTVISEGNLLDSYKTCCLFLSGKFLAFSDHALVCLRLV